MELEKIKHLTISDIVEFAPIMKLSVTSAVGAVKEYQEKHGVDYSSIQDVCRIVRALGLYP